MSVLLLQVVSPVFSLHCHRCWPQLGISVAEVGADGVVPLYHLLQWVVV